MITTIIFILILSLLIIVHELGHFIAARRVGVKVENFSLGFGPVLLKRKKGDTEYSISAIPLGGFVKLAGDNLEEYKGQKDEYFSKTAGERFQIVFAGPLLNYLLGFIFFWAIFFTGYPTLTTKVGGVIEGYGAKKAGVEAGDKILSVDGKEINSWEDLVSVIYSKESSAIVKLSILRGEKTQEIVVPITEKKVDDGLGQKKSIGLLGVSPSYEDTMIVRHGPIRSFSLAISKTVDLTVLTYKGLWRVLTGKLSMKESVTGPLGIFDITSKAAKAGLAAILHLIAVLSVSLALFNVLPLPVLDGGHIFLLWVEKIRGKTLGVKAERIISRAGFTLIISLALFVTYNDIMRMFGDKISGLLK